MCCVMQTTLGLSTSLKRQTGADGEAVCKEEEEERKLGEHSRGAGGASPSGCVDGNGGGTGRLRNWSLGGFELSLEK